ncbi:MAG TPA: FGGY family carbohydrate kinase [Candidatus Polarisedimenticolia bacterium]|jgi:glycerol kinase
MKAILAIDQGTTASKAALYSLSGRVLGAARVAVRTRFGPGGVADQDPGEILATQRLAIRRAVSAAGPLEIAAAGVTSQRSTFVLWDRATGLPAGPAPTWRSTAAADWCARLQRHGARIRRLTGLPLSPHYSATKLGRLLDGDARLRRRAERGDLLFGNVATFLIWHLTGGTVHAVDPTQAARTLLFNLSTLDWDRWLLDLFGIPRAILPEVRPGIGEFGMMSLGRTRIPIRASLGDQQAAGLGLTGGGRVGGGRAALVNYGTGAFVLIPTGGRLVRRQGLLTSLAWTDASRRAYVLEGTINAAGALLDWLRAELGAPDGLEGIDRLCREARGDALMLPALHGLGSMFQDRAGARLPSLILGAGPTGARADVTRAAVESIAHMVTLILDRVADLPGGAPRRLVASGPLSRLRYLVQYQAALLPGIRLVATRGREATLAGIARAAAPAGGISGDAGRWRSAVTVIRSPAGMERAAAERKGRWIRMVRLARGWR